MTQPWSTGYSDCTTCAGYGIIFDEEDLPIPCPECDSRDIQIESTQVLPTMRFEP